MASMDRRNPDRRRGHSDPSKRRTLFGNRMRSDTTGSIAIPQKPDLSLITRENPVPIRRVSPLGHSSSGSGDGSENTSSPSGKDSKSKSFFAISGKKVKLHTSKFSLGSFNHSSDGVEESEAWKRHVERVRHTKSHRSPEPDPEQQSQWTSGDIYPMQRRAISRPFDFRHITHATPPQVRGGMTKIISAPSELRGIRTEDTYSPEPTWEHSNRFSSDISIPSASSYSLRIPRAEDQDSVFRMESPESNQPSDSSEELREPENDIHPLRRVASPIPAPPRKSSISAVTLTYSSASGTRNAHQSAERERVSPENGSLLPSVTERRSIPPHSEVAQTFGAAFTTPGDHAWPLKAEDSTPADGRLEDVPENLTESAQGGLVDPLPSRRASVRQSKSVPNIKSMTNQHQHQSSIPSFIFPSDLGRTMSITSDTLAGPIRAAPLKGEKGRFDPSRRPSVASRTLDGSWEDDIDYCYEHEAEADCDFAWECTSDDGIEKVTQSGSGERKGSLNVDQNGHRNAREPFRPLIRVPSNSSVPDLAPNTALSSSTYASELGTPSPLFVAPSSRKIGDERYLSSYGAPKGLALSPSPLIVPEYESQMPHDSSYEELLADGVALPQHYPLYESATEKSESLTESARSSQTPLSNCHSRENVTKNLLADGHRSSDSASSLPDLVHSRNRREEFDAAADSLAEHIAAISHADEASNAVRNGSPVGLRKKGSVAEVPRQTITEHATSLDGSPQSNAPRASGRVRATSEAAVRLAAAMSRATEPFALGRQSPVARVPAQAAYSAFPVTSRR